MSETEHYTGELVEISNEGSVEDMCKQICREYGKGGKFIGQTWREKFEDEFCEDYIVVGDAIYKVELVNNDPYDEIYRASKDCNGRIKFEVKYHNGGCGFTDALKKAFKGIE